MKKLFQNFLGQIGRYNQLVNDYKRAAETSPDHALAHVNWGIDLAQNGQMDEALAKFEQASQIAPNRSEPFLNWGVALAKMGRFADAIEKFQAAIERDPKASNAYMLWGAALVELGDFEGAGTQYATAVELSPENPEPYVNWGIALARIGQYHEAVSQFKQALAIHGYQPQVYFLWGAVLAELQDYEGAIEKFKLALRFVPKHAEAFYFWSVALNRLGRYEEALEKSKKAIELELDRPEVYLNQGDILANLNRLDAAVANYQRAVERDEKLGEAYLSWGVAVARQGHYEEAYQHFQTALDVRPGIIGVQHQWGHYKLEQKEYGEALAHLQLASIEEPANTDVMLNLAMARIKTGQAEAAIEVLFEIEKQDRWNPQVHYMLGTHFMGAGDLNKALEHLKKALEERPDFEDASINLALVMCEMGETEEAVRAMRAVYRKQADSARVNFFYGTILYRHGDLGEALEKYQKAVSLSGEYLEPRIGIGEVYLKMGRLEEAEGALGRIIEHQPDCVPALFLQGLCRIRKAQATENDLGLYAAARQSFEQVINVDRMHLDAHSNLAYLLGRTDSIESMNAAFGRMAEAWPADSRGLILYYWSRALSDMGEVEQAEAKRAEAIALQPEIEAQVEIFSV